MAVGSGIPYSTHIGNGVATVFGYSFTMLDAADMVVTVDDVPTTAYSIAGVGSASGGSVTFSTAPASGAVVVLRRVIELVRATDYQNNGDLLAPTLNTDFDRLWMALQAGAADVSRTIRVPEIGTVSELPLAADRAGLLLGFDSGGDPALVAPTSGSAADLALSLASDASSTQGAGQVGFNPALAYADGAALALQRSGVTPRMFGAVGDGVTDDTAAVVAWAASAFPHSGDPAAVYYITGAVTLPMDINGRGCRFKCSAAGSLSAAGSATALPALSASPAAGDQALSFSSAHGLADGDVIVIYNPTNGSFSSVRNGYKAGEYARVYVSGSATVDLIEPLHAGYTAGAVSVYKLAPHDVAWRDFTVIGPDAVMPALKLSLATSAGLHNVRVVWGAYCGLYLDRCYDVAIYGGGVHVPKSGISDCFGLLVGNSQNITAHGGHWHSLRNATDCGGDNVVACVPNRNIRFIGSRITNKAGSTGPAANLHGNTERVLFSGCAIVGGASFEGSGITYDACHISGAALAANALMVGGSECLGGTYTVRNCTLVGGPAYSVGLVRISNAAAGVRDSHLILENNTVTMGACDTFARNDMGSATYKANVTIDGITFTDGAPSLASVLRMVGTGAAGDGDFVIVDNIHNAKSGALLYFAASGYGSAVKCRLMAQTGTVTLTPASGVAILAATATYRLSYGSKTPHVTHSLSGGVVNGKTVVPYVSSAGAASASLAMRTADSTNFGATTPDITAYWHAQVAEI